LATADQKQHLDLHRKLMLRRALLEQAAEGAVYLPFCGDGDIAAEVYADRELFAADIDPARIATFSERFPKATTRALDCDSWPFQDLTLSPLAIADFDAYSYPYHAFRAFWQHAPKARRLVLFFTDGERQAIKRTGHFTDLVGKKQHITDLSEKRARFNNYWSAWVKPWFEEAIKPYRVVALQHYLRRDMLYWGAVIERNGRNGNGRGANGARTKRTATGEGRFGPAKRKAFLEALRNGIGRGEAARSLGIGRNTPIRYGGRHADFAVAVEEAEMAANERVENALFQAAISGNVTACQVWLYNRVPERWQDKRQFQHTGAGGGPIDYRNLGQLSDEELKRLAGGDQPR
jgi:hypothetical protein